MFIYNWKNDRISLTCQTVSIDKEHFRWKTFIMSLLRFCQLVKFFLYEYFVWIFYTKIILPFLRDFGFLFVILNA